MTRNEGAKSKLLKYFLANVGRRIPRKELEELCKDNGTEWARSLRALRDDGWVYEYDRSNNTYLFPFPEPKGEKKDSRYIPQDIKAMVLLRDQSTCQMCGRNVKDDHIVIHIDHIVPHSWGGETVLENLQCLCKDCNEGKKNWEASENPDLMMEISKATNTEDRLRLYFEYYPNKEITVSRLSVIARTREWTRQLRRIRANYDMDIEPLPAKKGIRKEYSYIYHTDNESVLEHLLPTERRQSGNQKNDSKYLYGLTFGTRVKDLGKNRIGYVVGGNEKFVMVAFEAGLDPALIAVGADFWNSFFEIDS